jgi:hypothetical protein
LGSAVNASSVCSKRSLRTSAANQIAGPVTLAIVSRSVGVIVRDIVEARD